MSGFNNLNKRIRGFALSDIFDKIGSTERVFNNRFSKKKASSILFHNYIIKEEFLNRTPLFGLMKKERYIFGFMDLLLMRISGKRISNSCGADIVRVQNNLRGFYLGPGNPFSTKVLIGGFRNAANLRNEIEARLRIDRLNSINIPRILSTYVDSDPPFLVEEFIDGRRANPKKDKQLVIGAIEGLWKTYRANGIDYVKISDIIDQGKIERMKRMLDEIDTPANVREFNKELDILFADRRRVPQSYCHGDFSLGNTIVRDDRIYIIDWEKAGRMPISFDFIKVYRKIPEIENCCEDQIKMLQEDTDLEVLPWRHQLALGLIDKIASGEMKRVYSFLGREAQYQERLKKYLRKIKSLIGYLN